MDPRLHGYYNDELRYLRDLSVEFAQEFPKVAGRLGISSMSGMEVADPYVERLLEGVAFLAARVQLKLDAEFPRFTQALLEIVYPHYLAPTPSMLVAQLRPDAGEQNLARGITVPRGTALHASQMAEGLTIPEFRTAQDVTLWPLTLAVDPKQPDDVRAGASYFSFAPDLPLASLPGASRIKGGIRIRLRTTAGLKFRQLALDRLRFYLTSHDEHASALYELLLGAGIGGLVVSGKTPSQRLGVLSAADISPVGFSDEDALLPVTRRSFQGYRLLQEYFAFPQRFLFFDIRGLQKALSACDEDQIELVWLFNRGNPALERIVDGTYFSLFCTPAINLFEKHADRILISDRADEYHVVPDRANPEDFEVYQVTSVVGHGVGTESETHFRPFYATGSRDTDHPHSAYFTTRRERRRKSESEKRRGTRSPGYFGTEVFLSMVDGDCAPFDGDLRQLSVRTLCTNRDLPMQIPAIGTPQDMSVDVAAHVTGVRIVAKPSRPVAPLAAFKDGAMAWRAINHLSLNYLSLVDSSADEGAAALRNLLELYAKADDPTARRQIEAIRSARVGRIVRRLPASGPITFGRGLEIALRVDGTAFEGGSAFVFGSVLNEYFRRYVSMNSFTETVLQADGRGEINRWVPQWGARPTL
jgi:type VI secretion system protein ImpG